MEIGDLVKNKHTGTLGVVVKIVFDTDCVVEFSNGVRTLIPCEDMEVLDENR